MEATTEGRSGCARMPPPHKFRRTPNMSRGPIGSSTEGPSGCARMQPPHSSCAPLTRFVAP
eukprot:21143-Pyramimonas_sp.AAC.1